MIRSWMVAWLPVALVCSVASAEHRAALLIGNGAYPNAALASPPNDVRALQAALGNRGFTVTVVEDADAKTLQAAVEQFARSVPTRGTALVYFSGYALRIGAGNQADNYLLPIDGNPAVPGSVAQSKCSVRWILEHLQTLSGSIANIVLVDGCYAHPRQNGLLDYKLQESSRFPAESIAIYAAPFGSALQPAEAGLSQFAEKLVAELNSTRTFRDVLQQVGANRQATLDDLGFLALPASRAVRDATELKPGNQAGDEWVNDYGIVFCWCPAGSFRMGSPVSEPLRGDDETPKTVSIKPGFWIAKYEFTRQQVKSLTGGHTYLSTGTHKLQPLDKCRKDDAARWLEILNKIAPPEWRYAVPTEEQWEYAARAGTTTPFYFGSDPRQLVRHANFADVNLFNSEDGFYVYADRTLDDGFMTTAKVGSFQPNPWGLCDVYGNLSEHCDNAYEADNVKANNYPNHVIRGGSWLSSFMSCRSSCRNYFSFGTSENVMPNHAGYRFVIRQQLE